MSEHAIGIDFGTSTTVAAVCAGDKPQVLADDKGRSVFPSVVAFPPAGGFLIGEEAKYRRPQDAENTIFSVKRLLGLSWSSQAVSEFRNKYPFRMEEKAGAPRFVTRAGSFVPEEIAAKLIRDVLSLADQKGSTGARVVVGVPADFSAQQRTATLRALELAGCDGASCIDEPLAIARACLYGDLQRPRRIAVYDLGGGTFDVALCQVGGGTCTLLASGGDAYLGGDDLDERLADWVAQEVLTRHRWEFRTSPQVVTRLRAHCERAKIMLSTLSATRLKLAAIEPNDALTGLEIEIERRAFEQLAFDLVRRSFASCDEALARSGISAADIDEVYLAGGTTQIPCVRAAVQHYFGKQPRTTAAPDHLVALGAAIVASELAHSGETPSAVRPNERRVAPRLPTSMRVEIKAKGSAEYVPAFASDLSSTGVFISGTEPPPVGTELSVRFTASDTERVELSARVVRRLTPAEAAARSAPAGAGIEFVALTDEQRKAVAALLTQVESLFVSVRPRS